MSAGSENMPVAASTARPKPALLRHLPYFIGAAVLVALAAKMQFDGYILNILLQATTFSIAVFGLFRFGAQRRADHGNSCFAPFANPLHPNDCLVRMKVALISYRRLIFHVY